MELVPLESKLFAFPLLFFEHLAPETLMILQGAQVLLVLSKGGPCRVHVAGGGLSLVRAYVFPHCLFKFKTLL